MYSFLSQVVHDENQRSEEAVNKVETQNEEMGLENNQVHLYPSVFIEMSHLCCLRQTEWTEWSYLNVYHMKST